MNAPLRRFRAVLPKAAADTLRAAAKEREGETEKEREERIDYAIQYVKRQYPSYFKK